MANRELSQILGTTRSWQVTAMASGKPIMGVFVSGDVLTASVWRGESQALLFSPTVAWIDSSAATIKLTITAAQLAAAGLTPGVYSLLVTVTPLSDGQTRAVHKGQIKFESDPGSEPVIASWVSYQDLTNWSPSISTLQDRDDDLTQFARQRNYAMTSHVALIVRRYCPVLGGSFRFTDATGLLSGPYLRRSGSPDGSSSPTREQVRAWLLTPGRIVLNEDVIEANALLAASMVYGGQPGNASAYAQLADREYGRALKAMDRAFVEIDTQATPNGTSIIRVNRDVVYLT